MTKNFLKKSVFALLVLLTFAGCEKINWESIELNGQECPNAGSITMQISNETGVVKISDVLEQKYFEMEKTDVLSFTTKLYPCNIDNNELIVGKKIKISGIIYARGDADDTNLDSDLAQIVLSSAKYHK